MADRNILFNRFFLSDTLRDQQKHLRDKIHGEDRDYILNVNEDEYLAHLESEFKLSPLELDRDGIEVARQFEEPVRFTECGEHFERMGSFVEFSVPFSGERELFFQQPNTSSTVPPRGVVTGNGELRITLENRGDAKVVRANLDKVLDNVAQHILWQGKQIDPWNRGLPSLVAGEFRERKDKFLKDAGVLGELGFPLRKRSDVPATFSVPVKKKIGNLRPKASSKAAPYEVHSVISDEDYEDILAALRKMALTIEHSPSAYVEMDEENLRMQFLLTLNGSFEAEATGETFNMGGKTDILLKKDGKNLFIAECKFWSGPKQFLKTVDQLLGYLTWRDSRVAILLFVRGTSMGTVLGKVPDVLSEHPNFLQAQESGHEAEFRARMKSMRDPSISLDLAVQVYHIPSGTADD